MRRLEFEKSQQETLNESFAKELKKYPYGSEKPITLCEAFVRKYLSVVKSSVCMQMRRKTDDVLKILKCMETKHNTSPTQQMNELGEPSMMVQYTWSNFFQQSISFAKSCVALNIPERSCITIQGFNSPEHFISIMGTMMSNSIFSD